MSTLAKKEEKKAKSGMRVSSIISLVLIGIGLFILFTAIDGWAVTTFARPILAASLIAAIDIVLFLVAIALAPSLSWLMGLVIKR